MSVETTPQTQSVIPVDGQSSYETKIEKPTDTSLPSEEPIRAVPVSLSDGKGWEFPCPQCRKLGIESIIIVRDTEVACQRFIHAIRKDTGEMLSPYTSAVEATELVQADKIRGCGKAFFFNKDLTIVCKPHES